MTVLKTGISWTDSTWNPTTGCQKVSAGCDHCYAEAMTNRFGRHDFSVVQLHPNRIRQAASFKPLVKNGAIVPRMVFVNSMSDLHWQDIPDAFRHDVYDAMESNPATIFQILTKRPGPMRRFLKAKYGPRGTAPKNLWFGVSIESDQVRKRVDVLRDMKQELDVSCAFVSVEPLIASIDHCQFEDMDWVLIGGESGPKCRPMDIAWLNGAIARSRKARAAIWFKQFGHPRNNGYVTSIMMNENVSLGVAFKRAIDRGYEKLPNEKGGATLNGRTYRELPAAWHILARTLMGSPCQPKS